MGSTQNQSNPAQNPEKKTAVDDHNDRIPEEAKKILKSLASKWEDTVDPNTVQVIPLKGAMTNEVYQIKWPTTHERSRKVLVRIYGEGVDIFFDRENEIKTFEFMSHKGQGPRLLARFSNGRVEEFIRARVLFTCQFLLPFYVMVVMVRVVSLVCYLSVHSCVAFLYICLLNLKNNAFAYDEA